MVVHSNAADCRVREEAERADTLAGELPAYHVKAYGLSAAGQGLELGITGTLEG